MVEWAAANIAQSPEKGSRHPHASSPNSQHDHDHDDDDDHDDGSQTSTAALQVPSTNNGSGTASGMNTASPNAADAADTNTNTNTGTALAGSKRRRIRNRNRHRHRHRPSETPEAALARLTSSYSAAMSAVGALHKASHESASAESNQNEKQKQKQKQKQNEWESIQRVSRAARDAFEHAVLSDPLIQPYSPTFTHVLMTRSQTIVRGNTSTSRLTLKEDVKKIVSSAAHQNTLKELAYASLLNYADLLVCGCDTSTSNINGSGSGSGSGTRTPKAKGGGILDRGVVNTLQALNVHNHTPISQNQSDAADIHTTRTGTTATSIPPMSTSPASMDTCSSSPTSTSTSTNSLWSNVENEEWTRRLALVAYCDAADLDGSDPTIWLKLACAARRLGLVEKERQRQISCEGQEDMNMDNDNGGAGAGGVAARMDADAMDIDMDVSGIYHNSTACTSSLRTCADKYVNLGYERLERYALERGLTTLRNGLPPNRAISRAFHEFELEQVNNPLMYQRSAPDPSNADTADLIIDLPRYSWSTLGRSLLRACREGVTSNQQGGWTIQNSWTTSVHKGNDFASPSIQVKISPLLALPRNILANTCEFLGADARRLESTCRSLSVDIISARALIEKGRNVRMKQMEQEMGDMLKETEMDEPHTLTCNDEGTSKSDASGKQNLMKFAHRTSKRVRSQLITSGKQSERSAKRNSVEYCLISSIIPCTIDHPDYNRCLSEDLDWDNLIPLHLYSEKVKVMSEVSRKEENDKVDSDKGSALRAERCTHRNSIRDASSGNTSLTTFIKKWSRTNSGARDMLHRFLAHVSCYVDSVYECEEGNGMMLSQCISECFGILLACNATHAAINPSWYGKDKFVPTDKNTYLGIETLAMNLLSTELRMRTCERHGIKVVSFNDNVQAVRTNIPHLLQYSEAIMQCDMDITMKCLVTAMQTRCYWLAGIFYVWWSRHTTDLSDVKELEILSLEFIDKAIQSLQLPSSKPIASVPTQHLRSHGRVGNHWSELSGQSLAAYRNQIESSTVISRVRQRFQDIVIDIEQKGETSLAELPQDVKAHFDSIENDLFERYQLRHNFQGQKFDELISDFVNRHRQSLTKKTQQGGSKDFLCHTSPAEYWGALWNLIPSEASLHLQLDDIRDPTLLTMVILCYHKRGAMFASCVGGLLAHLIISVLEKRAKLLDRKENTSDEFAIVDDSDSSSDEYDSTDGDENAFDPAILLRLSHFLLAKLEDIVTRCDLEEFNALQEHTICALKVVIECSSGMLPTSSRAFMTNDFLHLQPSIEMLTSSLSTISTIIQRVDKNSDLYQSILTTTFTMLVRVITHGKKIMVLLLGSRDKNRLGRSECHALVMLRAKYIAAASSELASMLSHHRNKYLSDGRIEESFLIIDLMKLNKPMAGSDKKLSPLVCLAENLAWLWTFLYSAESVEASSTSRYAAITNTVHKYAANHLLVPIAGAITALVGAVGHGPTSKVSMCFIELTTPRVNSNGDVFSLSDFFASDESAKDWMVAGDEEEARLKDQRRLLQTLSRTIQCIGLVFSNYEDGELSVQPSCILFPMKEGFFLPLIVTRVLSSISDFALVEFAEEKKSRAREMAIWDDEYPFGFRSPGIQLDLLLHRAYRCLHGINISATHLTTRLAKDAVYPASNTSPPANRLYYLPQSTLAAIKIYRCLKRAYCNGRRIIPNDVLGCISTSLPKERESEKEDAIKTFIFGKTDEVPFSTPLETPSNVMDIDNIDQLPPDFPSWLLEETYIERSKSQENDLLQNDISIVRKGIAQYLADGPMPRIGLNSESNGIQYTASDRSLLERKGAADCEVASNKMLRSIIKALHYDPSDEKKWYRAGLCIGVKLNAILDRLIPAERGIQLNQFSLPSFDNIYEREKQWTKEMGHPRGASKLLKDQRRTYKKLSSRRGSLGTDLAVYMDHQFCDAQSLKALQDSLFKSLFAENKSNSEQNQGGKDKSYLVSVLSKYENGHYSQWQIQWGTLFVAALRLMRHRCFHTAMLIAKKKEISVQGESIYSEVVEALGTAHYNSIGFSAREQSKFEKRRKAQIASACYHRAMECLRSSFDASSDSVPATWELLFMIGKCGEKIANTLKEEQFQTGESEETSGRRLYETFLHNALDSYNLAIVEAKAFITDGNSLEFQGGGSSHGITEMVYRLHASRLKVLLSSVKSVRHERKRFIAEALRITSKHWFEKSPDGFDEMTPNDQLWAVLCDVVEALASARREQPFFHRSVYRHAQAILWAPLFHDPDGCLKGCLELVPAHKSYRIRGLDSGPCVNSAEPIINALFDKKRPQLVAVWVTTPASPTPFEAINESNRKFDRLRCKYISAFIECMYLIKRKGPLESLIKWSYAAPRDLPSFYDLSLKWALGCTNALHQAHSKDDLLASTSGLIFFAKKFANAALCRISMEATSNFNSRDCSIDQKKLAIRGFLNVYKCFLRLNRPIYNILWQSQQMRHHLCSGSVLEADALCDAFQRVYGNFEDVVPISQMSWEEKMTILQSATVKGQEMSEATEADLDAIKRDRKKRKIIDM